VFEYVQAKNQLGSFRDVWATYQKIWLEATTVFVVYLCSLLCYPALIL
jgi:hypothetical protein